MDAVGNGQFPGPCQPALSSRSAIGLGDRLWYRQQAGWAAGAYRAAREAIRSRAPETPAA